MRENIEVITTGFKDGREMIVFLREKDEEEEKELQK